MAWLVFLKDRLECIVDASEYDVKQIISLCLISMAVLFAKKIKVWALIYIADVC